MDNNLTPQQAQKLDTIAQRIINSDIGKMYMVEVMKTDGRLTSLNNKREKAMQNMKVLEASIIERQMSARTNELLYDEAGRRIKEMCRNGTIDKYLSIEDYEKVERLNAQLHLLLDALDSVFNDVEAVYDSYGLTATEIEIKGEVNRARKAINKWFSHRLGFGTVYEETIRSEGDRLYDYVKERQEVLKRKLDRIQKKQEKDDGKGRKG